MSSLIFLLSEIISFVITADKRYFLDASSSPAPPALLRYIVSKRHRETFYLARLLLKFFETCCTNGRQFVVSHGFYLVLGWWSISHRRMWNRKRKKGWPTFSTKFRIVEQCSWAAPSRHCLLHRKWWVREAFEGSYQRGWKPFKSAVAFALRLKSRVMAQWIRVLIPGYTRPPPLYEGHVPLSITERVLLAFGSAFMSLYNPWRGGHFKYWLSN